MKYTQLGSSDLKVSRICMGCMGFGDAANGQHSWTVDEPHTREIVKRGLELGINFFDTAIAYQSGTSEQYLGRALRDFAKGFTAYLVRADEEADESLDDLHTLFGAACALAELQQALPGEMNSTVPLRLVLDRRPFI